MTYVQRTTVKVSDELDALLRREAERRGVTISEVVREALERYLDPTASGRSGRRLLAAGAGEGPGDVAEHIEEILAQAWGRPATDRDTGRSTPTWTAPNRVIASASIFSGRGPDG
ncbi:MAG: ribbon-helix-helix domain-containing protein [Actinomycetota bacterium]|nr:ribbon-helix-helix domain-containing protein [Actinomycetota bacterium]